MQQKARAGMLNVLIMASISVGSVLGAISTDAAVISVSIVYLVGELQRMKEAGDAK